MAYSTFASLSRSLRRSALLLAGALCAGAAGAQVLTQVQTQTGVLTPFKPSVQLASPLVTASAATNGTEPLTAEQRAQLLGPMVFARPQLQRPGYYRIRARHSGLCAEMQPAQGFEAAHLVTRPCDDAASYQRWALLPGANGTQILSGGLGRRDGRFTLCVVPAQGVVFGPVRFDVLGCDTGRPRSSLAQERSELGRKLLAWQQFTLLPLRAAPWFAIQTVVPEAGEPECWDVRDSGGVNADVIRWGCQGSENQQFALDWAAPLDAGDEIDLLAAFNWRPTPDGPRRDVKAMGVELYGTLLASSPAAEDTGADCAKRCLDDTRCRAWTWSGDQFRRPTETTAAAPMCRLFSTFSENAMGSWGPRNAYRIVSGLVRP